MVIKLISLSKFLFLFFNYMKIITIYELFITVQN